MNTVVITGRAVKEIEARHGETTVARFTLAVDRPFKKGEADFIGCVAFGKTAEVLEKWSGKGCRVTVLGRIQTGSYEKNGQKVYTTDVIAERVELIDFKEKDAQESNEKPTDGFKEFTEDDEDLPF